MRNTSSLYKEAIKENRILYNEATISFADGASVTLDNSSFLQFTVYDDSSSSDSFDIGMAAAGQIKLKIDNTDGDLSGKDFSDAIIDVRVGLQLADNIEWLYLGKYISEPGSTSWDTITLSAYDYMTKFDQLYSLSNLTYPASLGGIVRDACSCCGVTLETATFDQDDFVVQERPDDTSLTFRDVLTWVGQIACAYLKCDYLGRLLIQTYDIATLELSEEELQERDDVVKIKNLGSGSRIDTDDVVITGIKVTESGNDSTEDNSSYQEGSTGYMLEISGNKLIQSGAGESAAKSIGAKLIGVRFRPMSITIPSDPSIEAGDIAVIQDRKGNLYKTIITGVTYNGAGAETVSCGAASPQRQSSSRFSKQTQLYTELRKTLQATKTSWELAEQELREAIEKAGGLFPVTKTLEDGSTVFYFCDQPTLEESSTVIELTAAGWAMSTDGGKTFNGGMNVNGDMIANILEASGINADWINAGALVVKDEDGNETFYADTATGEVRINASSFSLSGKDIEDYVVDQGYDSEDNLVKGWRFTEDDVNNNLWNIAGTITRNATDPLGGNNAIQLSSGSLTNAYINANRTNNTVLYSAGTYEISFWMKADEEFTAKILFNRVGYSIDLTTSWKKYTLVVTISSVSSSTASLFAIGGLYSIGASQNVYVYHPVVKSCKTQEERFNALTNNGSIQGIYMSEGKIYINAAYIKTGTLSDANNNTVFNLSTGKLTSKNGDFTSYSSDGSYYGRFNSGGMYFGSVIASTGGLSQKAYIMYEANDKSNYSLLDIYGDRVAITETYGFYIFGRNESLLDDGTTTVYPPLEYTNHTLDCYKMTAKQVTATNGATRNTVYLPTAIGTNGYVSSAVACRLYQGVLYPESYSVI